MVKVGLKFKSKWFDAEAQILSADVDKNECDVKLTLDSGYHWFETWNYQHTKWGFQKREYFYLNTSEKTEQSEVNNT